MPAASLLPLLLALAPLALGQNSTASATGSASGSASGTATGSATGSAAASITAAPNSTASNSTLSSSSISIAPVTVSIDTNLTSGATSSKKRGIVYVAPEVASDNNYWTNPSNDLTWYYNYGTTPTTAFAKATQLQFVPMQWGLPDNPDSDMTFYNSVKNLQKSINVTWVLGFNEPDGCTDGGSCIDAKEAAVTWVKQFEPMRKDLGIKLGGPACTGASSGWTWLQSFHTNCAALKHNGTGCEMDFLPIHWYGNFEGLAAHLGQVNATYSNVSEIWVTEFAYADQDLQEAQSFYNQSTQYFDRLPLVSHYSYFGPFRSDVSNIGPNAAFLDQNGNLTDIGSWYLGGSETGNIPSSASGTKGSASTTSTTAGTYSGKPYSSGSRSSVFTGWVVCVIAATAWALF